MLHIRGLDNQAALTRTGAVPITNMARAFARRQPIVVIDEATGKRQLIWVELDALAPNNAERDLMIHPGKDFTDGHTYVVALRNLRTANDRVIRAPRWFARLRAGGRLPAPSALSAGATRASSRRSSAPGSRARVCTRPGTSRSPRGRT